MIDKSIENLLIDEYAKLRAHPNLDIPCSVWDKSLHETLDKLRSNKIDFNMQGTNMSAEKWCVNLPLTEKAKEILMESAIKFSTYSWI